MTVTYERIGITASRRGLTEPQTARLVSALRMLKEYREAKYLHHGDCVGGDVEVARHARAIGYIIVGHPPIKNSLRAFFPSDWAYEPAEYLERDRTLADEVDLLLACPNSFEPRPRSGTWYTINWAERTSTKVAVILPDGSWRR